MLLSSNAVGRNMKLRGLLWGVSAAALLSMGVMPAMAQSKTAEPNSLEDLFGAEEPAGSPAPAPSTPKPAPQTKAPAPTALPAGSDPSLDELFGETAPSPAPKEEEEKKPAPKPAAPAPAAKTPEKPVMPTAPSAGEGDDLDSLFQDLPEPTVTPAVPPKAPELPAIPAPEPAKPAPAKPEPVKTDKPAEKSEAPATPKAEKPTEKLLLPSELLEESGEVLAPEAQPQGTDGTPPAMKDKTRPAWEAGGPEGELPDTIPSEEEPGDENALNRSSTGTPPIEAAVPLPSVTPPAATAAPSALPPMKAPPATLTPPPAAPMAPPPAAFSGTTLIVPFPAFQTKLTPDLQQYMERLASSLQGASMVEIVGYANWTANGSLDASKRLSVSRADAIRAYLVGKGIPATKITTRGAGLDFKAGVSRDRVEIMAR